MAATAPAKSTAVGNRYRQAGKTAAASAVAQAISVLAAIAIVPLALDYLGPERYGIWLTLSSFLALLGFMDLGLGNAVMTGVSRTGDDQNGDLASDLVSTGFALLLAVAGLGLVLWLVVRDLVDLPGFLGIPSSSSSEAMTALGVLVGILLLNLPLGAAGKAQWGLQRGYISSLWQAAGAVTSVGMVLAVINSEAGLPWIAFAIAGGTLIAATLNSATMYAWWGRWLRPRIHRVTLAATKDLAKLGFLFLGLQMAVVVAFASDNVVVARILGVAAVPDLAVPFKLFAFVPMILGFVLTPLWPAYGDAISRHDAAWVRATLRRSLIGSVALSAGIGTLLFLAGNLVLNVWTGGEISASTSLLAALAVWVTVSAAGNTVAMLLNGGAVVGFQLATSWSMAVVAVILKIVLVPRIGIEGAIWATVIAYTVFILVPDAIYVPRYLGRLVTDSGSSNADPPMPGGHNVGGRAPGETV